jgi:hypothetical protein
MGQVFYATESQTSLLGLKIADLLCHSRIYLHIF